MSALSRPWRHVWASIPKLVFSPQFCRSKPSDSLEDIISKILLQHDGAIKTFLLCISSIPSFEHFLIDQWMLFLSKRGIMDLTLQNDGNDVPYTLPPWVYDVKLESLDLSYCIIKPPSSFRGFHKLKKLLLDRVVLDLDVATSFLWMPGLVYLNVIRCIGLHHLKICPPKLLELRVYAGDIETLMWNQFMDCRELKTVLLASDRINQDKTMNLTYLLNCWPKVCYLMLDTYYLKCFACGLERHLTCLNSLNLLGPFHSNFADEDAMVSLQGMLRCSPNLKLLTFVSNSNLEMEGGMVFDVNYFLFE